MRQAGWNSLLGPGVDLLPRLPSRLQFLEILIPSTGHCKLAQGLTKQMISVDTLALVDRSYGRELGLIENEVGSECYKFGRWDSVFTESDWGCLSSPRPHLAPLLPAIKGIKRLVLRVDPGFEDFAFEPLEKDDFLSSFGEHADKGGFEELEEMILDVKIQEQFTMEECNSRLFIVGAHSYTLRTSAAEIHTHILFRTIYSSGSTTKIALHTFRNSARSRSSSIYIRSPCLTTWSKR